MSIQGLNAGMPSSGSAASFTIVESWNDQLARRREEDIMDLQQRSMDCTLSDEKRIAVRRQLILLESDPGPARTDAERVADESAKEELRYARRHSSAIYRSQRKVILDWSSTEAEKRAARALLTRMFGKLDDDLN